MKEIKPGSKAWTEVLLEYANSIIATLREPFLVLDKNLNVISANQAFYNTFEVTEINTIGRLLPDLGNGQWNIPKLLQLIKEIIPKKGVVKDYQIEYKFEKIAQRVMCLNARQLRVPKHVAAQIAAGVRGKGKEIEIEKLILLAIEDVTERIRLQEELKGSEERYRRAFETSRDALLLIHKTEGDVLNSNESAQELLGYSQVEFLEKKLWQIGAIKDHKDFHEMVSRLEIEGVIHYDDTSVKTKKGLCIDAEVFLVDKAKVVQCNIRNITLRKEADKALKESEMRFRSIFNKSTDGMLLVDPKTRRFFMCNPKICQMLGCSKDELMLMRADDIHPEDDLPFVIEQFERQAKGEIELAAGLPVKRKDGSIFYADISASQITLADKKYLVEDFRDITDRKIIQDELNGKILDLERFSKFAVDRELKMVELEEKLRGIEERLEAR